MDPNRFVERMLQHMESATINAREGNAKAANEEWRQVVDNLEDLYEWLERDEFPPTLDFRFKVYPD